MPRKQKDPGPSRGFGVSLTSGNAHICALGGTRTPNLLIRSQMLYPLSYERRVEPRIVYGTSAAPRCQRCGPGEACPVGRPGPTRRAERRRTLRAWKPGGNSAALHRAGADRLTELVDGALAIGLRHVSAYGFSTENWKRSPDEVANLMTFTIQALRQRLAELVAKGVRIRWPGRSARLRRSVIRELQAAEEATRHNTDLTLYLCVNYGGKAELADATAAIARSVAGGQLRPEDISEATIADHLYQPDAPDVELFLRPSGERRTSNFLIWELAFAEMVFMDVLWPDFSREHLWHAVDVYADRRRRASLR
jgi:trans,polycis-polyprenyl diphosphate synthase